MTTRLNLAVRGLFATPVAALEVPGAESINSSLKTLILERREQNPSVQASNAGGWHSDRDILDWGGPDVRKILDLATGMAAQLTADRQGQSIRPAWKIKAWANVNTAGHANVAHYHAGALLVGDLLRRRWRLLERSHPRGRVRDAGSARPGPRHVCARAQVRGGTTGRPLAAPRSSGRNPACCSCSRPG